MSLEAVVIAGRTFSSLDRVYFDIAVSCAKSDANYIMDDSRPAFKAFTCAAFGEFPECPFHVTVSKEAKASIDDTTGLSTATVSWKINEGCNADHCCINSGEKVKGKRGSPFHPKMFVDVCLNQVSP